MYLIITNVFNLCHWVCFLFLFFTKLSFLPFFFPLYSILITHPTCILLLVTYVLHFRKFINYSFLCLQIGKDCFWKKVISLEKKQTANLNFPITEGHSILIWGIVILNWVNYVALFYVGEEETGRYHGGLLRERRKASDTRVSGNLFWRLPKDCSCSTPHLSWLFLFLMF